MVRTTLDKVLRDVGQGAQDVVPIIPADPDADLEGMHRWLGVSISVFLLLRQVPQDLGTKLLVI